MQNLVALALRQFTCLKDLLTIQRCDHSHYHTSFVLYTLRLGLEAHLGIEELRRDVAKRGNMLR